MLPMKPRRKYCGCRRPNRKIAQKKNDLAGCHNTHTETLIKDDERRKAVNRGILLVAIALVVVVFFWYFFDDMSSLTDAPSEKEPMR